jgi:hypothetical protein
MRAKFGVFIALTPTIIISSTQTAMRAQPFTAVVGDDNHGPRTRSAGAGDISGIDGILPDRETRA